MVIVAMAYRAFKMRHPMFLTTTLLLMNLIELALVLVFKPNNHLPINRLRLYVCTLSVVWSSCGFLAQLINDRASLVSAILLCVGTLVWGGAVGYLVKAGGGGENAQAASDLEMEETEGEGEDSED
jgi:hypothetical protein